MGQAQTEQTGRCTRFQVGWRHHRTRQQAGMKARVYVGLGSNVEREATIRTAVRMLREVFGELQLSPVYDSVAVGFVGSNFLNLVAGFESERPVEDVVAEFRQIEDQLGRDRSQPKFSRRTIDLDILTYADLVLDQPGIQIPRNEILQSSYVLKPLQDIAPQELHPGLGETYQALWQRLQTDLPGLRLFPLSLD